MYSFQQVPAASSIFSAYASISASAMLLRSAVNEFVPQPFRAYLQSTIAELFKRKPNKLTLVIEEGREISRNELFDAAELYLSKKVSPNASRLKVSKYPKDSHLTIKFETGEEIFDSYEGIELKWKYVCSDMDQNKGDDRRSNLPTSSRHQIRHFELSFEKEYKEQIIKSYFPHVLAKSKAIKDDRKTLKLCTLGNMLMYSGMQWEKINLDHASTFDTLAMAPEMKKEIKDDLDRFVRRREFYRRVGRAWKRGYLLYGPPGTGKSSLIAAMANYLRFDIYDLQLGNLMRDSDLRRVLLATGNRSILVIEDIDCSVEIPDRKSKSSDPGSNADPQNGDKNSNNNNGGRSPEVQVQLTLSGLLNFIDGLWSSCGDERIIIFTTNHKERLDPALLRPGRMDMHIHMSYLTAPGFKTLASNYLNLGGHRLFREIEGLIEAVNVSPAQVAEELMRSEDADVALDGVVRLLKRKKREDDEAKIEDDGNGCIESVVGPKRRKILENGTD